MKRLPVRIFETTDGAPGQVPTISADGTIATWADQVGGTSGGGVSNAVTVFKAADETAASATLQNDDHFSFAIGANEKWSVTWTLYATCASSTPDLKVLPSIPAGATMRHGVLGQASTATSTESSVKSQAHATAALTLGVAAGQETFAVVTATIENGATAGTIVLQWAQNATDAANPVTLKRGSFMIAHKQGSTGGSGGSLTVQDENTNVATAVTQIDFQGAGVTTTAGTGEVIVTIPGGGGTTGDVDGGTPTSTYSDFIDGGTP